MDLSTIRSNLADGYYEDPADVNKDVQLMFKNCFLFNPPGTPVAIAGKALQAVWEEKWRNLPPKVYESESEEVDDDAGSDDDGGSSLRRVLALPGVLS
jgi:bromodomain-containing factor 1